jgi:hypothetical protein
MSSWLTEMTTKYLDARIYYNFIKLQTPQVAAYA